MVTLAANGLTVYFVMRSSIAVSANAFLFLMTTIPAQSQTEPSPNSWSAELLDWRAKHAAELQKPDGWLSLAGLEWLEPGENSFGAAEENKIHLAGAPAAHLGILHLEGTTVRLAEPPGGFPADFRVAGMPAKAQVLPTELDNDKNAPHLTAGTLNMYVIRRADRFALRVKDSNSAALVGFHGLDWYEADAGFRVSAKWTPYHPTRAIDLLTLAGTSYSQPVPGVAEFEINGTMYRLEPVVENSYPDRLFFILRDTTSASTTYGACRFLYTGLPDHGLRQPGGLVLDFNRLENPPCAYTPFSTCPLPPKENRLSLALPVGERRYKTGSEQER